MQRVPKLRLRGRPRSVSFTAGSIKSSPGFVSPNNFTVLGFVMYLGTAADYALAISEVNGVSYSGMAAVFGSDLGIWGGNGGTFAQILTYANNIWYGVGFTAGTVSTTQTTKGYVKTRSGLFVTASQTATAVGGTTDVLYIGNDNDGSGNPNALLSGWRAYDYPLSPKEINEELQQRAPRTTRGLKGYLPFSDRGSVLVDEYQRASPWTTQAGTFTTSLQTPPVPEVVRKKTFVYFSSSAASGAIVGNSDAAASQTGTLTGAGALAGTAAATASQTATLQLYGRADAVASQVGTLRLFGRSDAVASQTGAIAGTGALSGTAAATSSATATAGLSGSAAATASQAGTLQLYGSAAAVASQTGTITGAGALAGSSAATASQTGAMSGPGSVSGESDAVAGQSATLRLFGSAAAVASQTGSLGGAGALAGSAATTASQTGAIAGAGALAGNAAATASQAGVLAGAGALAGSAAATASQTGALSGAAAGGIAGNAAAVGSQTGTLTGAAAIAGESDAVGNASATTSTDLEPSVVLSSALLVACASSSTPIVSVTLT